MTTITRGEISTAVRLHGTDGDGGARGGAGGGIRTHNPLPGAVFETARYRPSASAVRRQAGKNSRVVVRVCPQAFTLIRLSWPQSARPCGPRTSFRAGMLDVPAGATLVWVSAVSGRGSTLLLDRGTAARSRTALRSVGVARRLHSAGVPTAQSAHPRGQPLPRPTPVVTRDRSRPGGGGMHRRRGTRCRHRRDGRPPWTAGSRACSAR